MVFREIVFGTDDYRRECELRNAVLREPLGLALTAEELACEADQLHFGLFGSDANLVGCVVAARLSPMEARVRQMAVSPSHQRRGLGTRILNELEADLRSRGFTRFILHARASAVGFYERLGYTAVGAAFVDVGVPHFRMVKAVVDAPPGPRQ